jgi:hypothetical protein
VAAFFAGFVLAHLLMIPVLRYATGVSWSAFRVDAAAVAVVTAHAFISAMLCVGFFRATSGQLTTRSLLVAVACGVPILAGGPALLAALNALQPGNPLLASDLLHAEGRLLRVVLNGTLCLVVCAVVFRFAFARQRRLMEWMVLEIDR